MTTPSIVFRAYRSADKHICLSVFDLNCPEYFDPEERKDYVVFLDEEPDGYEVCEADGQVHGAFGVFSTGEHTMALRWILLSPESQGQGLGAKIMARVVAKSREARARSIRLFTTQKAEAFFKRFGAETQAMTANGFGPGLDRVDMIIKL